MFGGKSVELLLCPRRCQCAPVAVLRLHCDRPRPTVGCFHQELLQLVRRDPT